MTLHKHRDDITPTSPLYTRLTKLPADLFLVTRRAASLGTRRTVKQQWQAGWLLRAVTCIDLTTLAGDDTETNVARLCLKVTRVMMMKMIDYDDDDDDVPRTDCER